MALAEAMGIANRPPILLAGQEVECRLVSSRAARKLRIKVKSDGIEVVVPDGRTSDEAWAFLTANQAWATAQLERARRLVPRSIKRFT